MLCIPHEDLLEADAQPSPGSPQDVPTGSSGGMVTLDLAASNRGTSHTVLCMLLEVVRRQRASSGDIEQRTAEVSNKAPRMHAWIMIKPLGAMFLAEPPPARSLLTC